MRLKFTDGRLTVPDTGRNIKKPLMMGMQSVAESNLVVLVLRMHGLAISLRPHVPSQRAQVSTHSRGVLSVAFEIRNPVKRDNCS